MIDESTIREKWNNEKHIYQVWGEFIAQTIQSDLIKKEINIDEFIKIPVSVRVKETNSLIDKALYRNKKYSNPYNDIEDKVGIRFVVLLTSDIEEIESIIKSHNDLWEFETSRDFKEERNKNPLAFTYQSVHYILRSKKGISYSNTEIITNIPCEIQIRTLLQHAHAELTHDRIYKSKEEVKSKVNRIAAKSMALIETTDEFFTSVAKELLSSSLDNNEELRKLNMYYQKEVGVKPNSYKSQIEILSAFERLFKDELADEIINFIKSYNNDDLIELIKNNYNNDILYQQGIIFFLYWMMENRPNELLSKWPLSKKHLSSIATDIGRSIGDL